MTLLLFGLAEALAQLSGASQPVVSPAPPPPGPPVLVKKLPDYSGRCAITPKTGVPYTVTFVASGRGSQRRLTIASDSATFPSGSVRLSQAFLYGGTRYLERFEITDGTKRWEGKIEWYDNSSSGYLTVEPIEVGVPINFVVINRCEFTLKRKS
jgi:hypothetical protein